MKLFWILGISFSLAALSACSSGSHSSTEPEETGNGSSSSVSLKDIDDILNSSASKDKDTPKSSAIVEVDENGFKRSGCDLKSDENTLKALDLINERAFNLFEAFSKKRMNEAKSISAEVKPLYKKVLDKNPRNCNAQLGYAVAIVADLANNKTLRDLYNDYDFWFNKRGVESLQDFTKMITELSVNKSFTKTAQSALENEVLPAVDSAITFMQYIMDQGGYVLNIRDGGYIREMDNSEFGLALSGLFATKAAINIAISMNLEIDDNGDYSWINNLDGLSIGEEAPTSNQKKALVKIVNLIGLNGTFSTIYTKKQKEWKSVPSLVDSALVEARDAFKYSLDESMTPGSQENDLYVVGKGADADISISDIMDIIENLNKGIQASRGPYKVSVNGKEIVVNGRKYFENVEGIQKFLPYYKFNGSDLGTFYFTDKSGANPVPLLDFLDGTLSFPKDGEGKIIFRDPTFGGVFPEFTQKDIWELLDHDDEDSAPCVEICNSISGCYLSCP